MNIYFSLFLRIVHILAVVLWVGAAVAYFAFYGPTVKSIGPAGSKDHSFFILFESREGLSRASPLW